MILFILDTALDMFTRKDKMDCILNDIGRYEMPAKDCAKRCLAMPQCIAFVTNIWGQCWVKSECINPTPNVNSVLYQLKESMIFIV